MNSILKGEKVYLKLVEKEDLVKRVEWINDPEVQDTLNYDYPTSLAKTQKWFEKVLTDRTRRDFSIFTTNDNVYIGFCSLFNFEVPVMKAELAVVIGDRTYWKGGYGTEAYKLLIDYGFVEMGLNKIYGYQLVHNNAAHRVVEKLGWKRDGLLRQDLYSHGTIKDRYAVSIIRKDWIELKNN